MTSGTRTEASPAALPARVSALRHRLRRLGDARFDPDAALMRADTAAAGHYVPEGSREYADLLLEAAGAPLVPHEPAPELWAADPGDPGAADRDIANRILRAIAATQDRDPASPTYGNFRWRRHDAVVRDLNAGVFLAHGLARLARTYDHLLEDSTRAALDEALPLLLLALRRREVPWQYTNIHLMTIGGLMQLAALLADDAAAEDAAARFDAWVAGTSAEGFHEWGCGTYTPLAFAGLEAAWDAARDERLRDRLAAALDVLTAVLAVHVLPHGAVGGAAARAYPRDLTGRSLTSVLAHLKLGTELTAGTLERCGLLSANLALYDYRPRVGARRRGDAAWNVRERTGGQVRVDHGKQGLSLSSQSLQVPVGYPAPPAIFMVADRAGDPVTLSVLPCADGVPAGVDVHVVQERFVAIASLAAPAGLDAPAPSRTPRVLVHGLQPGDEIWLDGERWNAAPRNGVGEVRLALELAEGCVGVVVSSAAWRLERVGAVTRLELEPLTSPVGVLVQVEPAGMVSAGAFAAGLDAWELSPYEARDGHRRIATGGKSHGGDCTPLLSDGELVLRPGELEAIVDGRAALV